MDFRPGFCPYRACPSRLRANTFCWQRRGKFKRACDGRRVQRFACGICGRTFSTQSFRLDKGLRQPGLHFALFDLFISKVTHRQSARLLGCDRKTVAHRLKLLANHARDYQEGQLESVRCRGGLPGDFQLDELETFEHSRRLAPVTMPVLIELHSYFAVITASAPLPCRGNLKEREKQKKLEREAREGKRLNGSREAVRACFAYLHRFVAPEARLWISTDRKSTYPKIVREVFGTRVRHAKHSSTAPRTRDNPLFPINHTLAMLRDGLSRLVRRNWAASKKRDRLTRHAWIWIAYRNYIRYITNDDPKTTSAMKLGIVMKKLDKYDVFTWTVAPAAN